LQVVLAKKLNVVLNTPLIQECFLFPTKKNHHRGLQFEGMEDIQKITMAILKATST
jgi:hypothetical protein